MKRILVLMATATLMTSLSACGHEAGSRRTGHTAYLARWMPGLLRALESPDWTVRRNAAAALGLLGSRAETATPALGCALDDPHPQVRQAAAEALARIQATGRSSTGHTPTSKRTVLVEQPSRRT